MKVGLVVSELRYGARRSWHYHRDISRLIGFVLLALMPTAFLLEEIMTEPAYQTAWFRLLPSAAALPLIFYDKLPVGLKRNFDVVWLVSLIVVFPFNYSYVLSMNAALAADSISYIWMFEFIFATVLLVQVASHALLSLFTYVVGVCLGLVVAWLKVDEPNWEVVHEYVFLPAPVYLTTFVVLILTNRNLFRAQEAELRAVGAMGSTIAHELRTPLATIRALASGRDSHLPMLLRAYEFALSGGGVDYRLKASQKSLLREVNQRILNEVEGASTVIDMLLLNTVDRSRIGRTTEVFWISEAIREAVEMFPYSNATERKLVRTLLHQDFQVNGTKRLLVHALLNLIKNGLRYAQKGRGTQVLVSCNVEAGRNILIVRDDGVGIDARGVSRVFDLFFTSEPPGEGTGIGLNYCKVVMESLGGRIRCKSKIGEFTEFRLFFPRTGRQ